MTTVDPPLGRRIALARQHRGLSRRALGDLVGRSAEWVRQVERGDRPVDRLSVLLQLATVLQVADVAAFVASATARPVAPPRSPLDLTALRDAVFTLPAAALRRPGAPSAEGGTADAANARPDGTLGDEVTWLWAEWQNSAEPYTRTLGRLPAVLRAATGEAAAHAYRLACQLASRVGDGTTALAAAQHAVLAARDGGCACTTAAAIGTYAQTLAHLGALPSAEAACDTALRTVGDCACAARPAVAGRLHLAAARIATAGNAAHAARRWLSRAAGYAREAAPDDPRSPFGVQDVALQAVRVALRLGHLSDALRLSARVEPDSMPDRARRSRGFITLACVHARARSAPGTLLALGKAEQACAEELRVNRYARRAITDLLSNDDGLVRADAWALAGRAGLA
ncbi:Transcriptional regulator, contains XRE-family HTH domain [Micromonospora pallida]|uniref:Transcriptional regulator, contains XRE-family HTH domain n=1 Tax=Micromonospora pallida TaxID=145854 RepID=A0A1C6RXG3_9ACTN|nr:helix-turn-helix transcriptional regulator [Micromonospora pallida]SCL21835.1 Transcriptional regulator, contains XRE-family HTH domain [Micromonospora pallida]